MQKSTKSGKAGLESLAMILLIGLAVYHATGLISVKNGTDQSVKTLKNGEVEITAFTENGALDTFLEWRRSHPNHGQVIIVSNGRILVLPVPKSTTQN